MARPEMWNSPQSTTAVARDEALDIGRDCVSEASRESFPASDPPAWINRRRSDAPVASSAQPQSRPQTPTPAHVEGDAFEVDVSLVAELLQIPMPDVQRLMREGEITSICERGFDRHQGRFRLTFFHCNRRARLSIDSSGRVLEKSVVDLDARTPSTAPHSPNA